MKSKKVFLILAVIFTAVLVCGCSPSEMNAKSAFENMMDGFKARNEELINEYYNFGAVTGYIDKADGEEYRDAILKTLDKMEYKVNFTEKAGENAVRINADITTVDFSDIIERYIKNVMELVESRDYKTKIKALTDEEYKSEMAKRMVASIVEAGDKKMTKTVDVIMIKTDKGWTLGGEPEELMKALFADLGKTVDSLT